MHTLLELAGLCEEAKHPYKHLDRMIWQAVDRAAYNYKRSRSAGIMERGTSDEKLDRVMAEYAPRYSFLIDDALKLVPAWWATSITQTADGRTGHVNLYKFEGDADRPAATVRASAATPALALCAAALKARAAAPCDEQARPEDAKAVPHE